MPWPAYGGVPWMDRLVAAVKPAPLRSGAASLRSVDSPARPAVQTTPVGRTRLTRRPKGPPDMHANDLFLRITEQLIVDIEAGTSTWKMPWRCLADIGTSTSADGRP